MIHSRLWKWIAGILAPLALSLLMVYATLGYLSAGQPAHAGVTGYLVYYWVNLAVKELEN